MGKKRDNLNAWEVSTIQRALEEWARMERNPSTKAQAFELAEKVLKAKSMSITHG